MSRLSRRLILTGGVYYTAYWGAVIGVQRFWPTRAHTYYAGFANVEYFAFRPSDGQLFYSYFPYGIYIDDAVGPGDSSVPSPPCLPQADSPFLTDIVDPPFGFDAAGTLYYNCEGIRYGDGQLIRSAGTLAGVLADGRTVVVVGDADGSIHFAAVGTDGQVISELPSPTVSDTWVPLASATTVIGNDAFVLLSRSTGPITSSELTAYRLNPQSAWLPVRSWPTTHYGLQLVIPDGTIFVWEEDTAREGTGEAIFYRVLALLPDGTETVAWRTGDSPGAETSAPQMLVGPAEPSGPSLIDE
jgi:hypothetical protein